MAEVEIHRTPRRCGRLTHPAGINLGMTIRDLFEAEPTGSLTPKQARKRADRMQRQQTRIRDERTRSAAKIRDLQSNMP